MTGCVSTTAESGDEMDAAKSLNLEREAVSLRVTAEQFKAAMGSFAAGVTIVTSLGTDGVPHGMTATAFTSLSLSPPQCLVCVNRNARAHRAIVERKLFAVNILGEGQRWLSSRFASSVAERFAGVAWSQGGITNCPIFATALAWMECRVSDVHRGGDHDIIIGETLAVHVNEGTPLVYFRGDYSVLSGCAHGSQGVQGSEG